jgi:hypothetical protein
MSLTRHTCKPRGTDLEWATCARCAELVATRRALGRIFDGPEPVIEPEPELPRAPVTRAPLASVDSFNPKTKP